MSSLCKYSFITINKNDSSPTPTLRKTLNPCNDLLPVKFLQTANFIKRISLLILPRTPVKASMTVETALVLPLFCFFMIHMGSAIEMMRLHGNLEVALWDAGRQVGIYGGILSAGDAGERITMTGWEQWLFPIPMLKIRSAISWEKNIWSSRH